VQGNRFTINPANNAMLHNQAGINFMKDQDYYSAIMEFKLAIDLNPNTATTATYYNNLGLAYLKINRPVWAETCFNRAIEINPGFLEFYQNLVKSYKMSNTLKTKRNYYSSIFKKNPSNSAACLMAGLISYEMGDKNQALEYFRKFKFLEPNLILTTAVSDYIDQISEDDDI